MGLAPLIGKSKLVFAKGSAGVNLNTLSNWVTCRMPLFGIYYDFAFGDTVEIRPPKFAQQWVVGIVQNVLFNKIKLVYEDGLTHTAFFEKPLLDVADSGHAPFLHGPIELLPPKFKTPVKGQTSMTPMLKIWYTSRGIGEHLIRPTDPHGVRFVDSLSLSVQDQPSFGAMLHQEDRGPHLSSAESILSLQNWLIAKNGGEVAVLARMSPFSLVFWADFEPSPTLPFLDEPKTQFGHYCELGITRKVVRGKKVRAPKVRVVAGKGRRAPLLDGDSAVDRGRRWYKEKKLAPD